MKKMKENIEQQFQLRPYRKGELSMLYFPGSTKDTAIRSFRRWLNKNTALMEELASVGYDKNRQYLHKHEVAIVVKHFGEPF